MQHTVRHVRRIRGARIAASIAAVTLLAAGCGSTALTAGTPSANGSFAAPGAVVPGQTSVDAGLVDQGLGDQGLGDQGLGDQGLGAVPDGSTVAGTDGVSSSGVSVGTDPGSTATTASTSKSPVTTPVKVGIAATDIAAIASVFGGDGKYDLFAGAKNFAEYLNKRGGAGGRKIELVTAAGDSGSSNATNGQRLCQAFTQDNKVEVVIALNVLGDVLPACLKAAGIALIDSNIFAYDATVAQQFPNWFFPSAIRLDRSLSTILTQAASRGTLKKGDKLGVLIESCPWGPRVYGSTVKPLADKLGVSLVTGSTKCIDNIVADLAPVTNDVQREVLRFAGSGVTHVLTISQAEAFVVAAFTKNASQQRFKPKYLVSSNAFPYNNSGGDGVVSISTDALPNMSGAGHLPLVDVGVNATFTGGAAAAQKECQTADPDNYPKQNGERGVPFANNGFYSGCASFFTLVKMMEATGGRTPYPELASGFKKVLSAGVPSPTLNGGRYASSAGLRTDGAGYAQSFVWNADKQTFLYKGSPAKLP